MNKKNLIIIISIVITLSIILFLLSSIPEKKQENNITRLTDEKMFYQIQDAITNYINNKNYNNPEFILKKVYYKKDGLVTYYYTNGYILDIIMDNHNYQDNINYLLMVKGNSYTIFDLKQNQNEKYLNTLNKDSYKFKNGNVFNNISYTEKNKLISYISEFSELLSIDSSKAYQMLNTATKNKYNSYSDFLSKRLEIYKKLNTTIKTYKKEQKNNLTIYSIIDSNNNIIKIYETSIMDYKIDY